MRHLDEGVILSFLDGELGEAAKDDIRAHLAACEACRSEARHLREASNRLDGALALLDAPLNREKARVRLQERVRNRSVASPPPVPARVRNPWGWGSLLTLPRAAGIVLLLAGSAAAAVPGSPVREWAARGWSALQGPGSPAAVQESSSEAEPEVQDAEIPPRAETGATLLPEAGRVELWVEGVQGRALITVAYVDGDRAGIFAGSNTRYRTETGRIEAWSPTGPVRVEIPRGLTGSLVGVNGEVVLRESGGAREILGPVVRAGEREIVFEVGRPPGGGKGPETPNGSGVGGVGPPQPLPLP